MRKTVILLALFFLAADVCQAGMIPMAKLKAGGINPEYLYIDRFSPDSSTLFALEKRTNPKDIFKKGGAYMMRMIRLDDKKNVSKIETIDLPIRRFHQIVYSDDTKQAFLASESGANMYLINIPEKTVKKIAGHTKGVPGFRVADPILYYVGGYFYAYGYFYDAEDLTSRDVYLARVHLDKKGQDMFEKTLNMSDVREVLGISTFGAYLPPDRVIWGVRRWEDAFLELKLYDKGQKKMLDSGIGFSGVVHTGDRIFYVVKKPGKKAAWDAVVRDLDKNNVWHLGEKDKPYSYPFISQDGSTVAFSLFDFKKKVMSYFYALHERNFKIEPIKAVQDAAFGTFRISPDGKWFAFYNPRGILVDAVRK